jgi:hypothetical protein
VDKIMAAAAEMGVEIQNTRVTQPPELFLGFNFYIEAYWRLHTCRPQGMTEIAWIPWTAINEYAKRYGMEEVAFYRFVFFIERMDEAFRNYVKSKSGDSDGNTDVTAPEQETEPLRGSVSQARARHKAEGG